MTINTNRWTLDTCSCIVDISFDDTQPPDTRAHNLSNYVRRCSFHNVQANDTDRYNSITEENPRKNNARQHIIDNAPVAFVDTNATTGLKTLKPGLSIDFSVAGTPPNRIFTMIFRGVTLTQAQINNVQTKLDSRFGAGRVIFVNNP